MTAKRILAFLSLLALLNGYLAWHLTPGPEAPHAAEADETWGLPILPEKTDLDALSAQLRTRRLWDSAASPAPTAGAPGQARTKPAAWKFVGIVKEGGARYMLALDSAGDLKRFQAGDALPDDATLLAVHENAIEIESADKITKLSLYRNDLENNH